MIDALFVVYGPKASGKTLNRDSFVRRLQIGTVIHGDPLSSIVGSCTGNVLVEVTTAEEVFTPPDRWLKLAKRTEVFSVHQMKTLCYSDWVEPLQVLPPVAEDPVLAAPASKPYVSPVVERRVGFDPAKCSPEQWAALVWFVNNSVGVFAISATEQMKRLREGVTVLSPRISADEPRTGDCLELAAAPGSEGRRFFFSNADPKRTIGDPVAWRTLCKTPGSTVHLGGLPA